ncbi:MAG: SPOR domain-containing protein, partial [Kangiellaceae bacterium]|nr:SPOR domain-containing protein [Kangiellaceae bacterium]
YHSKIRTNFLHLFLMKLEQLISDLLYRYECVIVPNFGAFVSNYKPTVFNEKSNTFYPPSKAISFNSNVLNNDALLANSVASTVNCSYNEAVKTIAKSVTKWQSELQENRLLELNKIGSFSLNNHNKLIFEPSNTTNYLTDSYGLSTLIASQVDRQEGLKPTGTYARPYLKYAAVFVLGLATIGFSNRFYQQYKINQQIEFSQKQQETLQNKIQTATFKISNPLPSITLKSTVITRNFHVVAGAFREPSNAARKLKMLKAKGFEAAIIGKNKWQLTQVVFGSYTTKNAALKVLRQVRATEDNAAWLLVEKH